MPERILNAQDSSRLGLSKLLLNIPTVRDSLFTQPDLSAYEAGVLENQIKLQRQLQAYRELYLAIHTDRSPIIINKKLTYTIIDEKLATFVTTICRNQWNLNLGHSQEDSAEALQRFFPSMSASAEPWKWFVYSINEQKIQFNNNSIIIPKVTAQYSIPLTYQNNAYTINNLLKAEKWLCNENLICSKKDSFDEINTKNSAVALPINTSIKNIQAAINHYQEDETTKNTIGNNLKADLGQGINEVGLAIDERKKSIHIFSQSNYLLLSLNRFDDNLQKISVPVGIQKNITIPNKDNGLINFELIGIIIHRGETPNSGHYVAYIADQNDSAHRWYLCDDSEITPMPNMFNRNDIAIGLSAYNPTTDGYILFYKRADYNPIPLISTIQLHNDLAALQSLMH